MEQKKKTGIDKSGVEKLYAYQEQIDFYNKQMADATSTYQLMLERMARISKIIAKAMFVYEKPSHERMALEKIEKDVCKHKKALRTLYAELVYYRSKEKGVRRIIDGVSSGLSSIQSKMKFDPVYITE